MLFVTAVRLAPSLDFGVGLVAVAVVVAVVVAGAGVRAGLGGDAALRGVTEVTPPDVVESVWGPRLSG